MKQRVGQKFFHDAVFSSYENKCCITGIAVPSLLIASHIKPWRDSDDLTEKTKTWIVDYEGEKIFMPRKFFPGQRFIEYHQDVIFQR